jgi:hypothetical protein
MSGDGWRAIALLLSLALADAHPAAANDSMAEFAAGGLEFVKTDAIALQREDLTLSPAEVRVRYEMRNDSGQPVTARVAFPIPEVPSDGPGGMTTSAGGYNIALKPPTEANFLDFQVSVDGHELKPDVEIRALLPDGRDVAPALREIGGLPLVLQPGLFDLPDDKKLTPAMRQKLVALGAYEKLDDTTYRLPWTTRIAFHWMQTFKPGVTVVEHSYRPIVGFRFIVLEKDGRISGSGGQEPVDAFCIDASTDHALRALERTRPRKEGVEPGFLNGYTLGYVLKTARNWNGPIGTFHLELLGGRITLDGRRAGEVRVTSLCTDLPLARTGPQRFEATVHDYMPHQDLRVLYVTE